MDTLNTEAKFKEFEPRLKFKPRHKYGWFHLKFIKFGHWSLSLNIHCGHFWFLLNPLFFSLFGYNYFVPTNESSLINCALKCQNFSASNWLFSFLKKPLWLVEFIHFSEYKLKIKLIWRIIKRWAQALISISTILKFSALET